MFFTLEDYKKIQNWLLSQSIKDTELPDALGLEGKETVAIVLNGNNVKVRMDLFVKLLQVLGIPDLINATDKYNCHSLTEVIQAIPGNARKKGIIVTFCDLDGKWLLYQFTGDRINLWNTQSLWTDVIKKALGSTFTPDEEDLTISNDNLVHFKDKMYNPDNFSGKGKVYLRKNVTVIDGIPINLLTQRMLSKENTIYIILYDFNLNGESIIVPEGCTLLFDGGSINNGNITFIETNILPQGYIEEDLFNNVNISGSYKTGLLRYNLDCECLLVYNDDFVNVTKNTNSINEATSFMRFDGFNVNDSGYIGDGTSTQPALSVKFHTLYGHFEATVREEGIQKTVCKWQGAEKFNSYDTDGTPHTLPDRLFLYNNNLYASTTDELQLLVS